MGCKNFILTKNEKEIMNLLWEKEIPLSRTEIVNLSVGNSWKANSIHILLNSLLDKEAIKVVGFVKTGKNYGRTFSVTITMEQYQIMRFKNIISWSSLSQERKTSILIALTTAIAKDADETTLNKMMAILQNGNIN